MRRKLSGNSPHNFKRREVLGSSVPYVCGVEMWCGGLGAAYLLPPLSVAGASIASPCFRFHIPLIESDVRIFRFRLSEKGSRLRPQAAFLLRPSTHAFCSNSKAVCTSRSYSFLPFYLVRASKSNPLLAGRFVATRSSPGIRRTLFAKGN
jgi:hypothetical protein